MNRHLRSDESGFTLIELLITAGLMLVVMAGASQVMTSALRSESAAKQMLDMNSHLRATMDLMQRDMLQVGQGLPVGRRIGIPNGTGAQPLNRPGPGVADECPGVAFFPTDSELAAVTVGAGLGPSMNGDCTDVITILAADNLFGPVPIASIASNGQSLVIHNSVDISDSPDVRNDNLQPGDLLMLTKGSSSVLMQVTEVEGQVVTFGTGAEDDPIGLNQFDTTLTMLGTINQIKAQAPADPNVPQIVAGQQVRRTTEATRIRMITYYVDNVTDPQTPRLSRVVGGAQPNAVGLGVQALRFTYDIADGADNPASVRMTDADMDGSGACDPNACSVNQIRKVNILLSMRAGNEVSGNSLEHGRQSQNTLYTQVSLRSLAFVDRYR